MARFVFVSGTDTGVGKTFVSGGLARSLVRRGARVVTVKPIETGCPIDPTPEEDGVRLALATGQRAPTAALVRLRAPVTPAIAAEEEGVTIDVEDLAGRIRALGADADVVIVEGAGGLLSPITWTRDFEHLVRAIGGESLVLVAPNRLGVIHQVRATAQCAADTWLMLDAVVLSASADVSGSTDASLATNVDVVRRFLGAFKAADRLFVLPRVQGFDDAADHLEGLADHVMKT